MTKPSCPHCKAEIKTLTYRFEAEIAEEFWVTSGGEPELSDPEISQTPEMQGTDAYSCPECDHVVATELNDAIDFLTGRRSKP